MRLSEDLGFSTLSWVKPELDQSLTRAREALEAYAEDPAAEARIETCLDELHQVQGSLRMVELYGAAMVVDEMEAVARALKEQRIRQRDEAFAVLHGGMVQLPDYLERLQGGHKDIPIVLLPLLNDLRACRGEKLLSESVLFCPNIDAPLPEAAAGASAPLPEARLKAEATEERFRYQRALLHWIRGQQPAQALSDMISVLDRLRSRVVQDDARRLFWVAAGALDAVRVGGIEASAAVKLLFGRVDREIRKLIQFGEPGFRADPPRDLVKNLLYYLASSTQATPRVTAVERTYKLRDLLPTERELEHAKGSLVGKNRALLDTVSAAIKEDLLRVKDALDLHLRSGAGQVELAAQIEVLDRVGDTLGMLGLGEPRKVVQAQREHLASLAAGERTADERTLLEIASALIYVESSLDDNIDRLGAEVSERSDVDDVVGTIELPAVEVRKIIDTLMKESEVNLARVREAVVAFIEAPWDHRRMHEVPQLLNEVAGAMSMLAVEGAPELLTALRRFVETELLEHRRVPDAAQLDLIADAFASIEYYVEASREHRLDRAAILEKTRQSLAQLGYWPPPEPSSATPIAAELEETSGAVREAITPIEPASESTLASSDGAFAQPTVDSETTQPAITLAPHDGESTDDGEWVEVEEEVEEDVEPVLPGSFQSAAISASDAEIREIFLEEVAEEIAQLEQRVPAWSANRSDQDLLKTIRRSFHTLKGSGRLVGAVAIGEFSWKVENMLNRVLDGTIRATDAVVALVEKAVAMLPELRAALAEGRAPTADLVDVMSVADELAQGREAWVGQRPKVKVRRIRRVWVPRVVAATAGPAVPGVLAELAPLTPTPLVEATVTESEETEPRGPSQPFAEDVGALAETGDAASEAMTVVESKVAEPEAAEAAIAKPEAEEATVGESAMVETEVAEAALAEPNSEATAIAEEGTIAGESEVARIPALDPLLLEILRAEVGGHIETLRAYLATAEAGQAPPVGNAVVHAIHTMHGALSMADIPGIAEVAGPLEGYAKRLCAQHLAPDAAGIRAMREAALLLEQTIVLLDYPGLPAPSLGDLPERIVALRDALPEAASGLSETEISDLESELDSTLDLSAFEDGRVEPVSEGAHIALDSDSIREIEAALDAIAASPAPESEPTEALESVSALDLDSGAVERIDDDSVSEKVGTDTIGMAPVADAESSEGLAAPPAREADSEALLDALAEPSDADLESEVFSLDAASGLSDDTVWAKPDIPQAAPLATAVWTTDPEGDGILELPDVDPDLVDLFIEEANEQLDVADDAVARLRDNAGDREALADLQRELHTMKGNARAIGLTAIGDLTHAIEALIEAAAAGAVTVDRRVIESLERGFDRLHAMVNRVARRLGIARPAAAIAYFEALAGRAEVQTAAAPTTMAETATEAAAAAAVDASDATSTVPVAPTDFVAPAIRDLDLDLAEPAAEEGALRAPQELIRVRSDLLDSLVNFAGEVAIYRSRLEQQIGSYRANLIELDQTVTRLRGQLRQLEIETEAQILSRYQREAEASGEVVFDPLELDRFSTLQQLSRALSESVNDLIALQANLDDLTRQSETLLLQQSRVSTELQEGLMRTRMVPFDSVVPFLRRLLRQTGDELGKRAQLKIEGAQGEMDRNLLERMKAPLEHMLRNALAHGIESPEERVALGKPPEGEVRITVGREATEVVIKVSDDGRGMNRDAIRAKAIQRGLLRQDAQLSDRDLFAFVLESGFSTAEQVTQIAGRGVGMDVVASEIKQLGGSLSIDSTKGRGTVFTIRLPFTLAVTQAVLVRVGEHQFAVPMSAVQGIARIARSEYLKRMEAGQPVFSYAGEEYSMHDLAHLLSLPVSRREQEAQLPLLLVRAGDQRAAVRIDGVLGSREVVVKSVGPQINSVPGIFGATIMGDGSVVMILDLAPLLRRTLSLREQGAVERALEAALAEAVPGLVGADESLETLVPFEAPPMPEPRRRPVVAVVDDSITMRRVTSRVLERNDLEVITAKDGLDAVERFQERVPDLILLDIEMPRMDGYELATYVRNDVRLRHVPIIMITSRTGEKHRQRAQEIGVNRYLGKPYQESELLKNVAELLNLSHELR